MKMNKRSVIVSVLYVLMIIILSLCVIGGKKNIKGTSDKIFIYNSDIYKNRELSNLQMMFEFFVLRRGEYLLKKDDRFMKYNNWLVIASNPNIKHTVKEVKTQKIVFNTITSVPTITNTPSIEKSIVAESKLVDLKRDIPKLKNQQVNKNPTPVKKETSSLENRKKLVMIATAYNLSFASCGKTSRSKDYGLTATGKRATARRTISVDPRTIPLGTKMYIDFGNPFDYMDGNYVAEDTGGAVKGNIIDVFMGETCEELVNNFGRRKVTVYLLGK
jgi:3D (Asp-Asp-Asp) domain-containing protein